MKSTRRSTRAPGRAGKPQDNPSSKRAGGGKLRDSVSASVRGYLKDLDGQTSTDFYQLVMTEVETPLLEEVMHHTRNNQTKAAQMLGLSRGTLRKKLKQYGLLDDKNARN